MRHIASLLLLGVSLTAGAAEIWRWTDANGVVHYADKPVPGAERISVGPAARPSGSGPAPELPSDSPMPRAERTQPFSYTRCEVTSPAADETFHSVQAVSVSLDVQPALREGHRIEVMVNGAPVTNWPPTSMSYTLPEVFRGSHTLQVRVLDANGAVQCTGKPLTFHLRQQSVLSPLRAPATPAPKPPPKPTTPRG